MRHRLEMVGDNEFIARIVELDYVLVRLVSEQDACTTFTKEGRQLNTFKPSDEGPALKEALEWSAVIEKVCKYPSLKGPFGDGHVKMELLLGTTVADLVSVISRLVIEQAKGGMKPETKQEYGRLMAELFRIWYASRFGSYDDERRVNEPYFMAWNAHEPRMNFAAAARCWGIVELENRLRLREGAANKLVGLVINLFDELLRSLERFQSAESCATKAHAAPSAQPSIH